MLRGTVVRIVPSADASGTRRPRQAPRPKKISRRPRMVETPAELAAASAFHGHLGPYLVVGLRIGRAVVREFGAKPFTYQITAFTGKRPPYSCLVDGVQLATPCTTGNGGMVVDSEKTMSIAACMSGERLVVSLRDEIYNRIENECTEENQERFALEIWEMPEDELLELERTRP